MRSITMIGAPVSRRSVLLGASALALTGGASDEAAAGASLSVHPQDSLFTTPVSIELSGVNAGAHIRLELFLKDEAGTLWRSAGLYAVDSRGRVNPGTSLSRGGTYSGVDADGLWWSMLPVGESDVRAFQSGATVAAHMMGGPAVKAGAERTYRLCATAEDICLADRTISRRFLDPDVEVIPVQEARLRGRAFVRRSRQSSRGAILVMTGSGGGGEAAFSPLLASAGYDVFSIAHFNWPGRPPTLANIDLEYFAEAIKWMKVRFGAARVAVQGASRGGELALLLGAYFPELVAGVTAIAANSHVFPGWTDEAGWTVPAWTLRGRPLPFVSLGPAAHLESLSPVDPRIQRNGILLAPFYDHSIKQATERAAIPVERISAPVLLISGEADGLWSSSAGSSRVIRRLERANSAFPHHHLSLPNVGHVIRPPQQITSLSRSMYHPLAKNFFDSGGEPQPTGVAGWTVWDALIKHYALIFGV